MPPRRLPDGAEGRAEAARTLEAGGIVAFPTDTVYGIAVALGTPGGIERLFAAKRRAPDRAIALLVADADQAKDVGELNAPAAALAARFWPGGLTLVVPRRRDRTLPGALTGEGALATVGLRVPDHDAPRALARAVGPLPTTSANRSGEPEARDADELQVQLGDALDLILDGGPAGGRLASTLVDTTTDPVRILRGGATSAEAIDRCLVAAGLPGVGRYGPRT
ncbi:MAG: threonylcarbamoyl-AMP synthase [Chloroflexi bacterium]|nr:MAG: threonylcarbamoyl-AMP synthase [Chloroflexota bacterium]